MSNLLAVPISDTDAAAAAAAAATTGLVVGLISYVVVALALYGVFTKAGKPGWAGFVPIYNTIVLLEVVGRPIWWFLLLLVPGVNVVIAIILWIDLAKSFGKGTGFAVGLVFLSVIFLYILWLGSATYRGPAARGDVAPSTAYAG